MTDNAIYVEWHISDVKDNHDWLTDDQCREVLQRVKYNHDSDIGINWDVIHATVNLMFPEETAVSGGAEGSLVNPSAWRNFFFNGRYSDLK
mgnify:FL=1|tara:strand:+ start:340 stop:612 length:273 start_codon:yes stop_codon:yes gene_type:complete